MPKAQSLNEKLNQPLPKEAIKQREGGRGMMLDYLEGWWVKQNANIIFGVDGWQYDPVWDQMKHIPLPDYTDKQGKLKKTGIYTCPVNLTVLIGSKEVKKGDIGTVQYYGEDSKEMAIKGCVTDGLKRCFSAFGEQFGLLLYDKGDTTPPTTRIKGQKPFLSQTQIMEKFGMDISQKTPKCQLCGSMMRLVQRKDGSGLFWGCPKWREGCKFSCNVDDVELDGNIIKKQAGKPKQEVKVEKEEKVEDIPF